MSPVSLPLDIFYLIVGVLAHRQDKETLKSLALTQHDLYSYCQPQIFATVELVATDSESNTFVPFLDLLESNPRLALHIKKLKLIFSSRLLGNPLVVPRLPSALDKLSNVEALTLDSVRESSTGVGWNRVDHHLYVALNNIIKSPKLVTLDIAPVHDIPILTLLLHTSRLRHLSLKSSGRPPNFKYGFAGEIPNSEPPPLQSFSYGLGRSDLIRRILRVLSPDKQPIFDFSRLSILSFSQTSFDGRDDISLKLLPLVVGLRELTIRVHSQSGLSELISAANEHSSTPLKTLLSLTLYREGLYYALEDPFYSFEYGLSLYPVANQVNEIQLHMLVIDYYHSLTPDTENDWCRLDEILADRHRFPCLKKVIVTIDDHCPSLECDGVRKLMIGMARGYFLRSPRIQPQEDGSGDEFTVTFDIS